MSLFLMFAFGLFVGVFATLFTTPRLIVKKEKPTSVEKHEKQVEVFHVFICRIKISFETQVMFDAKIIQSVPGHKSMASAYAFLRDRDRVLKTLGFLDLYADEGMRRRTVVEVSEIQSY